MVDEFKIREQIGSVEIILGGISAKYNGKDAIGDLLQEWLAEWLKQKNFYFRTWQKKYRELMDLLKDN